MKLNWDCFNNTLQTIESLTSFNEEDIELPYISFREIFLHLQQYTKADVLYCIVTLLDAGYITGKKGTIENGRYISVNNVTLKGHEYIKHLRNQRIPLDNSSCP